MGNPVVHWEINAKESRKLQEFYSTLFDWKIDTNNPMNYGMVETGGSGGIAGGIGQAEDGAPQYVTFYVQVPDLQACLDQAEKLGGKTILPPTEIPNVVTIAMFQDPEGNAIGLLKG
jgi:predicted enzyme related to lactoylglutathione lyase